MGKKSVHQWECKKCSYIYDPRNGGGDVPPNTAFEYIDNPDWVCPNCGAAQSDFKKKYIVVEIET